MGNSGYIRSISTWKVPPRWLFVRVEDSDGVVGWGEAVVAKRSSAIEGAVRDLARNVLNHDAGRIEELWNRMHRGAFFRGGPVLSSAIAAIDQALWDIKGRRYAMPVYEFFGGAVRDVTPTYAWIGGDRPDDVVSHAEVRVQQGYGAVKMNATSELDYIDSNEKVVAVVERVKALRDRFGPSFGVALDFHGRVHRAMAKRLIHSLDDFGLLWIEEPVAPGYESLLDTLLPMNISTPICTGERLTSRWEFRTLFETGAVDLINPDVSLTGLSELVKICRMAEAYDIAVAPHSPQGPICLAASLQACVVSENAIMVEHSRGIHYNERYEGLNAGEITDYVVDAEPLTPISGAFPNPEGVGLGIEIDEDVVRRSTQDWQLHDADWRTSDGRLAEW